MAMMLALAACGGGGNNDDGGGETPTGSLPTGGTFSSGSGVSDLSASSVTINGTTYDNATTDDATGVTTYTASGTGTAAVVDEDMVMASRVGEETLGATLESGVYGAYATGVGGTDGATTRGFYGGVNTEASAIPTTGTASYSGGAIGIETVVDDATGDEAIESYTGSMTADADFDAGTVDVDVAYDGFGAINSTGGTFTDGALTDGTVTLSTETGDAAEGEYTAGTKTLDARMVGASGEEMVGEVAMANADDDTATRFFSGGFGGASDDITPPSPPPPPGGDTSPGNDVPTGAAAVIPTGGSDGVSRPDLDNLTVTYDAAGQLTDVPLARTTDLGDDGVLLYTTDGAALDTGTANDTQVAYATRVGQESLGQTLDFTSFGVWSAEVDVGDGGGGSGATERRGGSFYDGTPPTGDITALTGTATYSGAALAIENVGGTYTQRQGDMSATADFDADTVETVVDFTADGGPGFTFGGMTLTNSSGEFDGTTTLTDQAGGTLAGGYAGVTAGTGSSNQGYTTGSLLGGDGTAAPGEIGGVFRVLGTDSIVGSYGGAAE